MRVNNPCPYLCQWDNKLAPGGTCNVTALAMAMLKYNMKGPVSAYERLPDALTEYLYRVGRDRHSPTDMEWLFEKFGGHDKFTYSGKWEDLKKHLSASPENLAIVHTDCTPSGHIVIVKGFDTVKGTFIINDPAGVWNQKVRGSYDGWSSGESVEYKSEAFRQAAHKDGDLWMHLLGTKG